MWTNFFKGYNNMYHCSSRDEICFWMWRRCDSSIWSSLIAGLIQLIWLARPGSLCCLMAPCTSFPKMHAWLKRTAFPNRRGSFFFFFACFFAQGYTNDCAPQLEPPKKLSRDVVYFFTIWTRTWLCNLLWLAETKKRYPKAWWVLAHSSPWEPFDHCVRKPRVAF